jgi:arginyl-tRNA synthetase
MQEKIKGLISESIKKLGVEVKEIEVTKPQLEEHGDYSTNISMRLAKELKKSPLEIADEIVNGIDKSEFESVEAVAPGFINFKLKDNHYNSLLKAIDEKYGENDQYKGRKIMVEYTDPNPFKVLHIGHLFTNIIGESLARLFEVGGAEVKRANYQGDVGLHVAKTMYGLEKKFNDEKMDWGKISKMKLEERVAYLGEAYALGNNEYEDSSEALEKIQDYNYYIFIAAQEELAEETASDYRQYLEVDEEKLKRVKKMYMEGREWCLEYFERIYKRVGTKFDYYFFESIVGEFGMKVVMENLDKVFERDEEAIIFRGKDHGLHTRVFVNRLGLPTYEAKDLGLAIYKNKKYQADLSVIITAEEQASYFKVMLKALEQIKPELSNNTIHMAHGTVKLPGAKKMSSRDGSILGAEWLLDEVKSKVIEKMSVNGFEGDLETVSDSLSVASVKYGFLRSAIGKDVIFDFDDATQFDGDTGPYVMYAFTRCNSILENIKSIRSTSEYTFDEVEKRVLRLLEYFPSEVEYAVVNRAPSRVVNYLFDLAQAFNNFYQSHNVLKSEGEEYEKRVLIVKATATVLKKGLHLIGIETVEKM